MLAALLAAVATRWGLPPLLAWTLAGLWLVKDLVLFPFVRIAYESTEHDPGASLLGVEAIAEEPLAPVGRVRLGAELWRARLRDPGSRVPSGTRIRVVRLEGLTLIVEPCVDPF